MEKDNKPKVFFIMPFNEECLHLYDDLKNKFSNDYEFTNAGDMDNQQNILKDIVLGISEATVIIADLTGLNANVFYELGLAHAMNKKVIIITQQIDELPFDIKSYRANEYSLLFYRIPKLYEELEKLLRGAVDNSVKYGNPVSDFIPNYFLKSESISNAQNILDNLATSNSTDIDFEDDQDAGFLDYITNINENLYQMTDEINCMKDEMEDMSNATKSSASEIDRVTNQSGNVDPVFVRNICRKLSVPIDSFAKKLHTHTKNITVYWSKVDNNYLALLDNKYTKQTDNISDIEYSIESLTDMKIAILESNKQIEGLVNSLSGNRGMERKLTKAIGEAVKELNSYLQMTDTIVSSIDRIQSKGEIVILSLKQNDDNE